jgi:hypothetical protein
MAIAYYLTIWNERIQIDPGAVRSMIVSSFSTKSNPLSGLLVANGVTINVVTEEPDDVDPSEARAPGVCVCFRIDKFDEYEVGMLRMLQITRRLLDRFAGDAVLAFEFEEVVLRRTGAQLILSNDPEFWTPVRREVFSGV